MNAITPLINNIRVDKSSDKKVITVEDVNTNKDLYRQIMKTPLEMLICPPDSIPYSSLPDALWEHDKPITEVFNSVNTNWLTTDAYDQESFLTQFHSIGMFKSPVDIQVLGQGLEMYDAKLVFGLPHICDIDQVYSDYDITVNFVISMISQKSTDIGLPCIFFVPKGGVKPIALTAIPEFGTTSVFRATINTAMCTKTTLFGAKGYFGFGVRSSKAFTGKVTLEVKGSCTLIRNNITPNVNSWIYNREKTSEAILQHVCSISLITLSSSSCNDVTTLWSYLIKTVISSVLEVINVLETTPSFLPAYEAIGQILVERLVTNELKEKMSDINNVKAWVRYALMRLPTWLNYEANNPFYYVKYDYRPQLAWRVLTMWYGARKVSIYTTSNKSIVKGAFPVLETYASPNGQPISTPIVKQLMTNTDLKKSEAKPFVSKLSLRTQENDNGNIQHEDNILLDIIAPYAQHNN
jgi:hypothetical protein